MMASQTQTKSINGTVANHAKATAGSLVQLIPWDFNSPEHIARLTQQREICGWHQDIVESVWTKKQKAGEKCIYWIVLSPEHASTHDNLQLHLSSFPSDKAPLKDTAVSINGSARMPTNSPILPIGHISVDSHYPEATHLDLDLPKDGVYWIKTFYISPPLRSKGAGRAAMDMIENMAMREPISAKTLALDTIHKDDARRVSMLERGEVVKLTNHEWYERRGYRLIETIPNFYRSQGQDILEHKTVFMRRDVL